ncbi:MAG: SRPBCC domain-containing protein [Bdellovibrio sp.]|nr:SRPBCC domain-containing protein [Bdellovibrio sp.]
MSGSKFIPARKEGGQDTDSVNVSITVKATVEEIWRALTDPDDLENWWSDEVTLEPKVGGKFREAWEDDAGNEQLASGKVLSLTPKKTITFTWKEKSWEPKALTECTYLIEDKGKTRSLTVTHTGWDTLPEKSRAKMIKDFQLGWKYHMQELKAYLDDEG